MNGRTRSQRKIRADHRAWAHWNILTAFSALRRLAARTSLFRITIHRMKYSFQYDKFLISIYERKAFLCRANAYFSILFKL